MGQVMGMPRINAASLRCPQCAGLTKLIAIMRADAPGVNERFSFECSECGAFEVLAIADTGETPAADPCLITPGAELQDLWA